jgi:hypothetical protein
LKELTPYTRYGIIRRMTEMRKITAILPAELLAVAQAQTGVGVTETLRLGLERIARETFYSRLRALRGKVKLDIDVDELRRDRDFNDRGEPI